MAAGQAFCSCWPPACAGAIYAASASEHIGVEGMGSPGVHAGMLVAWRTERTTFVAYRGGPGPHNNKNGLCRELHSLLWMWRCCLQAACGCWHHVCSSAAGAACMLPAGRHILRGEHAALHSDSVSLLAAGAFALQGPSRMLYAPGHLHNTIQHGMAGLTLCWAC